MGYEYYIHIDEVFKVRQFGFLIVKLRWVKMKASLTQILPRYLLFNVIHV